MRTDSDIKSEKYEIRADLKSEQTLVALYRSVHPRSRLQSVLRWKRIGMTARLECAICSESGLGDRRGAWATAHLAFHGLKNHLTSYRGGSKSKPRRNVAVPTEEEGNAMKTANQPRVAGKVSNVQVQASPPNVQESAKMDTATETNGSNGADDSHVATKESALKPMREAWVAAGSKMPTKEEGDKLKAAMFAARKAVDEADKVASAAREKLSAVCKVIMEKTGARTITIDGVDYIPSVHGKSYFFRARGERTPAVSL